MASLAGALAFVLFIGAAKRDATPEQRSRLAREIKPLLDVYREGGDPRPILDGCTADVAEYVDCDEQGRTHRTWMLLTAAAVATTTIGASVPADEME